MRIRGTKIPSCSMCEYALLSIDETLFLCDITKETKSADDSCKKFSYDICKYTPKKKNLFGKFSKEDFEID
ncbi:MAG: hypothetical protein II998_10915 [Clostridia bacterium]|nr:hypothetical protein [Clostridia bacterium]